MIQLDESPFLPIVLEDEHFVSYLWRWAHLSGSVNFNRGIKSLLGKNIHYTSELLQPAFLVQVANAMPHYADTEQLLDNHTQEKYSATIGRNGSDEKKFTAIVRKPNAEFGDKHLRWCTGCASADIGNVGMAYWRNGHQDPRLIRCQRHGSPLLKTCHLCKRKKTIVSKFGPPTAEAKCLHCSALLDNKRVTNLTQFQHWLEQLHHLSNHGVQVDRIALISRLTQVIELMTAEMRPLPRRNRVTPQQYFIEAFNNTRACDHFICGEIPFKALNSYGQLRLSYVLNPDIEQSGVIYALLGWVFLSKEERNARFGYFYDGRAVKEAL